MRVRVPSQHVCDAGGCVRAALEQTRSFIASCPQACRKACFDLVAVYGKYFGIFPKEQIWKEELW